MRVVLVAAPNRFTSSKSMPSLTLAVLSACLKSHDIDCECIDCNDLPVFNDFTPSSLNTHADKSFEEKILNESLKLLDQCKPDIVAVSSWGVSLPFTIVFSQAVRERYADIPIIVGGIGNFHLATLLMEHAKQIDVTVVGEGEVTFLEVIGRIAAKRDFFGVNGIVHNNRGEIYTESPSKSLPVHSWCLPDYSSFVLPITSNSYMVEGSRGCPNQCIFCSINNMPIRRKDPRKFADEVVKTGREKNSNYVSLADNFIPLEGKWIDEFCDALLQTKMKVNWSCLARADHISPATVHNMSKAGCKRIFLGVESISVNTLQYIKKAKSTSDYSSNLLENINIIKDSGINLSISTIIGFPHETIDDMQQTVDFVLRMQDLNIDAYTGSVVVYPGSQMWDMYLQGQLKLQKISNPVIRRNSAGLFASKFEDMPYFVPNNFLPKHTFLEQEQLENFLAINIGKSRKKWKKTERRSHAGFKKWLNKCFQKVPV